MNLIIHDLDEKEFPTLFPYIKSDTKVISNNGNIHSCIGCFGCWIKTPGKCVIKDGYDRMGELFAKTDKVIIISQCCYGGYSPFVKNILERSISYLLPFFKTIENETHHKRRYNNTLKLSVYFYGKHIPSSEVQSAKNLIKANCRNFYISQYDVSFYKSPMELCREADIQ